MRNQNTQDKTAWFAEVKYLLAWSICSTAIGPFSHSYTLIYDMDSYLCIYVHISMIASNLYTAVHACAACEFCFVLQTLPLWSSIQKLQGSKTWEHFFLFFGKLPLRMQIHPSASAKGCIYNMHIAYTAAVLTTEESVLMQNLLAMIILQMVLSSYNEVVP